MSFGYTDSWIDPPEPDEYTRSCTYCEKFNKCPCGCGWGFCEDDPGDMYIGDEGGCECGVPVDGLMHDEPDYDYLYDCWRDDQMELAMERGE